VPSHADPSVYSLPVDTLSHNFPNALLHALAMLSTISLQPFHFAGALPALDWVPNCHSNPITQRVRRKRQRLPPTRSSPLARASQGVAHGDTADVMNLAALITAPAHAEVLMMWQADLNSALQIRERGRAGAWSTGLARRRAVALR
jgi:hypothetical protein